MKILQQLTTHQNLSVNQSRKLLGDIALGKVTAIQTAAILSALRTKGETAEEVTGFVKAMRNHMLKVNVTGAIDVCGTGGDGSGTFNISTAVALVVAATGAKVAKHGNRAASSKCGSADALESLGVNIQLTPSQAQKVINKVGIVFLFAPLFHPAMKQVAEIRKELGIKTIFNLLGPFTNPAEVKRQLIGVPNLETAEKLAQAAQHLNYTKLIIVSNTDGLDEVSLRVPTRAVVIERKKLSRITINPREYNLKPARTSDIKGGSPEFNANIIHQILAGKSGPHRDIVVLNSAVALFAAGKVSTINEGTKLAQEAIDSGQARAKLQQLVTISKQYA